MNIDKIIVIDINATKTLLLFLFVDILLKILICDKLMTILIEWQIKLILTIVYLNWKSFITIIYAHYVLILIIIIRYSIIN